MLEEEATLLEEAKKSKVAGFKCKEVATRNKERQWPSKKTRGKQPGKYHRGAIVNMGSSNPYERCVCAGQDFLVHTLRWVLFIILIIIIFNNFLLHSQSLACTRCIALKQWYIPYTNTNTPAIISTYGRVLNAIEKAFRELVEEYRGVGKFFQDLVEG